MASDMFDDVRFSRVFDNAAATADIEAFTRRIVEASVLPLAAGGGVVEVTPLFDPSGDTALVGATLMYEILGRLAESCRG